MLALLTLLYIFGSTLRLHEHPWPSVYSSFMQNVNLIRICKMFYSPLIEVQTTRAHLFLSPDLKTELNILVLHSRQILICSDLLNHQ